MQLRDTYAQISISELVGNVEAERTELTSLQHHPVEERQGEEKPLRKTRMVIHLHYKMVYGECC